MLAFLGLVTALLLLALVLELLVYGVGSIAYVIVNTAPVLRRLFKRKS